MRSRALLTALLAALLIAPASARAADLFVDAGSLGGPCLDAYPVLLNSPTAPWCSLERAVQAAPEGGVIVVRGGRYPGLVLEDVRPAAGLTIIGAGSERPSISGLDVVRGQRLIFRGLRFLGPVQLQDVQDISLTQDEIALRPAGARTPFGVTLRSASRVVIDRVFVHDGRHGVALMTSTPPNTDILVTGSRFQDLGEDGVHITHHSERVTVEDNVFADVKPRGDMIPKAHADAVQVEAPNTGIRIAGNRVTGGRGFLFMVPPQYAGVRGLGSDRPVIEGNVLSGRQFGIRLVSVVGARIVRNTVWGTSNGPNTGLDIHNRVGRNARTTGLVLLDNLIKRLDVARGVRYAERRGNRIVTSARSQR